MYQELYIVPYIAMFPESGPGSLKVSNPRNLFPYKTCFPKMGEAGNIAFSRHHVLTRGETGESYSRRLRDFQTSSRF
jgi:hypothetical protein